MEYSSPELIVVGRAEALVLGGEPGIADNGSSQVSNPLAGIVLGLDD